jgi:hypothetical protein
MTAPINPEGKIKRKGILKNKQLSIYKTACQ